MMNCKECQSNLPDLFLSRSRSANVDAHLAACAICRQEYDELTATFALLDTWQVPEPSAFFDQRLAAHLRAEVAAPRESFFARMRNRMLYGSSLQLRPVFAGALALALIVGGGTYAGINGFPHSPQAAPSAPSATITDLQILDKNQQAIQQLNQLLQDDSSTAPATQPAS